MASSFVHKLRQLYQIHLELNCKGFLQKEIAQLLGLNPSAYSNLVNRVLEPLSKMTYPVSNHTVSKLFLSIRNLSEKKTRQQVDHYILTLSGEICKQENPQTTSSRIYPVDGKMNGYPVASVPQQDWIQTFTIECK